MALTPEQARALGKRSGEARRGLTLERIAEELPRLAAAFGGDSGGDHGRTGEATR